MWFGNQFDFFYFCFGLVCLLLWTSCRSLSIHQRKADAIGWLGGFGLLQGIGHWIGLLETQWHGVPIWLSDLFFVFACLSLLTWAGRIWSERLGIARSRMIAFSLLIGTLILAIWLPLVFAVVLVAGLPASIAGGVHLYLRKQSLLKTAAFALIVHGISLALFVPMTEQGWLPGAGAAYRNLLPVGLGFLCTLSMLVLAATLWRFDWILHDSAVAYGSLRHRISVRYSRQIFVVILFLVILTGWVAMRKSGEAAARQYTDRWFRQAEAAARSLSRAYDAEWMSFGPSGEPIRKSLSADEITWLRTVNEGFQQLLIVRLEGDTLKVQADSGRPGSPLKGLPDRVRHYVMHHQETPGSGILFDPIHDAWGERHLALFPLSVGGGAPPGQLWLVVEFNQGKLIEQVSRYRFYAILAMVMVVLLVFAADQQIRLNQAQMVLAEKHSHQLLASMNEGYAVFEVTDDATNAIQLVESNPSYDEWCGRSRATLREDQPGGIFPGAEDVWKEEILRVSAAGGGGHFRVGESDAARILDVSLYRVQPGRVACVIADRTREVRKDEALKQSEARFRALVERSPVGIIVRNAGDVILDVNPALSRMLNQSRNQLIGQRFQPMLQPTAASGEAKTVQRVMAGDVATREIRMKRADGGWIDVELQETQFLLPDGTHGVMSMTLDITDRKQATEKLVEVERNMRHAQKLESLGVMAGGIAHDFNNLLMGMMGNLDLSLMEVPRGSS
ncbi:MAG: PAS domain S-box protein, partial [Kiritimatiellae bacterium]|nr:PAS domain S-box protein [Kiritimatiellia bacterium]